MPYNPLLRLSDVIFRNNKKIAHNITERTYNSIIKLLWSHGVFSSMNVYVECAVIKS